MSLVVTDVAVIGAGPAGLMAAATAAGAGARVTLVERNTRPGRKLMLTGGGRCNVTHEGEIDDLIAGVPGHGRFLYPALTSFSNHDLIELLSRHGVPTVVEPDGRVFPKSERARDVLEALESEVQALGAALLNDTPVASITTEDGALALRSDSEEILRASRVVVATGGLSYPGTGSTGDGLAWATALGHRVTEPRPALVGLETGEMWSKSIPGVALRGVIVTLSGAGRIPAPARGDLLFTHFGVSGPPVLNLSRFAVRALSEAGTTPTLLVSNAEGLTASDWEIRLQHQFAAHPKRSLVTHLAEWWPRRLAEAVLGDRAAEPAADLPQAQVNLLARQLSRLELTVTGTRPVSEAIVTQGGVDTREVDPRTMSSKIVSGLYFAGEVLDIDGFTGGYNLQAAFSTGYLAGLSSAESL